MTQISDAPVSPDQPEQPDNRYWRSISQLQNPAALAEAAANEFKEGLSEAPEMDDVSRRNFMGIVAASVAMASMTSCRKPETKILPFARRPEDLVPGNPLFYATAHISEGYGTGVLVKSSEGRPTKVEGNPMHPSSKGAADHRMQAELLNLYDPDRSQHILHGSGAAKADDGHGHAAPHTHTLAELAAAWQSNAPAQGAGMHVVLPPTSSPSTQAALARFKQKYPQASVHHWAPVNNSAALAGTRLAFGQALDTHYDLSKADVVLAVDHDFMSQDGDALKTARDFANRRRVTNTAEAERISRLYALESFHSVTGSNADHRLRVRPSELGDAVLALAAELQKQGLSMSGVDASKFAGADKFSYNGKPWVAAVAKDLLGKRGRSALLAGPRLPAHVQATIHAINVALGNVGQTVTYSATPSGLAEAASLNNLATEMARPDAVKALVILGANPCYDAPADLDIKGKLKNVKFSLHLGMHVDETARHCTWHLNQAHDLECWGDIHSRDGTATLCQPLIAPLYGGLSVLETLALLTDGLQDGKAPSGYAMVQNTWKSKASGNFATWWARALHDGVIPGTAATAVSPSLRGAELNSALASHKPAAAGSLSSCDVQFRPGYNLHDGRNSNNAWLMELPDPMTKLCWDNAALVSLKTLQALKAEQGDIIKVTIDGKSVEAPVWVLPGHADHAVTLTLGYGRDFGDGHQIAAGAGYNAYKVRGSKTQDNATGSIAKVPGKHHQLVVTQEHGMLEGRGHVRENNIEGYKKKPEFAPHMSPLHHMAEAKNHADEYFAKKYKDKGGIDPSKLEKTKGDDMASSLWKSTALPEEYQYKTGLQWGMVIDLNTCIGCNACVSACVAENNIPTVGKKQIADGREMFWNRIDRYFGDEEDGNAHSNGGAVPEFNPISKVENPKVVHQMVPCMQCENASCEVVCPVAATVHSPEGLNDMAYNRCIGTRYCGNNCPYKVRHFNYFNFQDGVSETKKMVHNPDVTVRSRGVMEKCTYCVQRINRAKIAAKRDNRTLKDGDFTTACAQTCPTQAITFGNINDPNAKVTRLKASNLNYAMLDELNTRPRTTYLAKIRNPNKELV